MKVLKQIKRSLFAAIAVTLIVSCERDISDEAVLATFPNTPDIFTDDPVGLTDEFFISFDPNEGANPEGFGTDPDVAYEGRSSIRIDVPVPNDPDGGFIGGIFLDRGAGRNLTKYDALTFWAKGSITAQIGEVGFGTDFITDTYAVKRTNIQLSTDWRKYTIPIPDASRLVQELGVFSFAAGTETTGGQGYTFWMDELRFEKLGTLAQPRPGILNGEDVVQQTFTGANTQITGLSQTFNSVNGDITVNAAAGYFEFSSSNPGVAIVDANGSVQVVGPSPMDINGDPIPTLITATLGVDENGDPRPAAGSFSIISLGNFVLAPTPTRDASNVISIFSDAYVNVPVVHYNGYFAPFQTTQGQDDIDINGDNIIRYTDLNFVASEFYEPTVNATDMTHFHVDIQVQDEDITSGDFIRLQLGDFGSDGVFGGGNDAEGRFTLSRNDIDDGGWLSFDIPLSAFVGLRNRDNLAQIFFITDATVSDILVDNMYFYKEVVEPTPNVDDATNTQVALPIGFESTTLTYNITDFGGAESAVVINPVAGTINSDASSQVLRTTKTAGADFFAGTFTDLEAPIDFSTSQKMRLKVYSPKTNIPVRMALELAGGGGQVFVDANVTVANEWTELEFDFSSVINPAAVYQRIVLFYEFIPGVPGDGSIYYCDDIKVLD
jgi:hypothetical protein